MEANGFENDNDQIEINDDLLLKYYIAAQQGGVTLDNVDDMCGKLLLNNDGAPHDLINKMYDLYRTALVRFGNDPDFPWPLNYYMDYQRLGNHPENK